MERSRNELSENFSNLSNGNLREWAVENGMKVNPGKCKAIRFTRARVKIPLGYSLCEQEIPEASSCKYLGLTIRSDLNCLGQVNYIAQKSLEGSSLCNAYSQKRKQEYKKFSLHVIGTSYP